MTGPLIFLILMTFLVLAARREAKWSQRQAELAAVKRAVEAFQRAWPYYQEAMLAFRLSMTDLQEELLKFTVLVHGRGRRNGQDRVDALMLAASSYKNVTPVTFSDGEEGTMPQPTLPAGDEETRPCPSSR